MFKILKLFGAKPAQAELISQRQRFEAACDELNAVLAELDSMPKIEIDPGARRLTLTAPEQFADEALALPAPEEQSATAPETEAETEEGDAGAKGATEAEKSAA